MTPVLNQSLPALLVSYFYIKPFLRKRETFGFRDWVLDSGAFSAANSGVTIRLDEYTEFCKEQLANDPLLTEVYALDVIGDHAATRANTEAMWLAGVPAIPCFHFGQPLTELVSLARDYPKIALGGAVGLPAKVKLEWASQCFARVWPKRIHGFGMGGPNLLLALPFHSADASNWELGPAKFGRWNRYGSLPVRGGNVDLRTEVDWYLALEQQLRTRWAAQMRELSDQPTQSPSVRLAYSTVGDRTLAALGTLEGLQTHTASPTVRLAYASGTKADVTLTQLKE